MTDGNPIEVSTIMSLPEEILGLIFNKLTQNTALNLRRVCKKWKTEVDTHYKNWNIRLDDNAPPGVLAHILQLRIKTCTVVSFFESPPIIQFRNPDGIFKHPNLISKFDALEALERVSLQDEEHLRVISAHNLYHVLNSTSKNLKELRLALSDRILTQPFPYEDLMGCRFAALETLDIDCRFKQSTLSVKLHENNLVHELVNIPIPKLRSLSFETLISDYADHAVVRLSKPDQYRMSFDFLAFTANHGNVLENLFFNILVFTDLDEPENFSPQVMDFDSLELNVTGLRQIKCLKVLQLTLMNTKEESTLTAAWRQLILQQTQLTELVSLGLTIFSSGFRDVIRNNFATLKVLQIYNFVISETILNEDGEERCAMDFSIFEFCQRLKDFSLSCVNFEKDLPEPFLQNLSKLPKCLVELNLSNMKIRPVDIIDFIHSHNCLTNLSLENCGCENEDISDGVNGSVLEYILSGSCTNLKEVKILQLNSSGEGELQKLQAIFSNAPFNYSSLIEDYENVEFELKRKQISESWEVTHFYKGFGGSFDGLELL